MKLVAYQGGGDWYDASITFLVLPDGWDATKTYEEYEAFVNDWRKQNDHLPFISKNPCPNFDEWVVSKGGRLADDSDIEVVWIGP